MASLSNINGLFDVHSTGAILFSTSHGTSGQILRSNGNAAPTWVDASTVIGGPYLPLTGGTLTGATATASGISFTVGGALTVTQNSGSLQFSNTGSGHGSITTGSSKDLNISSSSGTVYINNNTTFGGDVTVGNNGNINIPTAASGNANLNFDGTDFKITSNSSSANLKLETSSTTRLTINSSGNATFAGNVGIGVAAHDTASLNITSADQHIRLNNGSELGIINLDADGKLDLWAHGTDETISFRTGTGSGTVTMSVVGENVGIGTVSPTANYPLTLRSKVGDYTKILDWGTDVGGSWGTMQISISAPYATELRSGAWNFAQGNVGIGDTNPASKLVVAGRVQANSGSEPWAFVSNPTSGNYGGFLIQYGNVTQGACYYNSSSIIIGSEAAIPLRITTGGQYAMHIDASNRNVHIGGTNNASEKLEVNGNIKAGDTTGKFFTNVYTATTASFADTFSSSGAGLWEYTIRINPNPAGSGSYADFYYGKVGVGTGWNGSNVTDYIWYQEDQTAPRSLYPSGGSNKTISWVMVSGGSEVTNVSSGTTVTIRVKGFGGNSYNQNINIYLRRLA